MPGYCYAFINFEQAVRFGHVGWGFQLEDGRYCFGSTDHLWRTPWWDIKALIQYMSVEACKNNDWWAETDHEAQMYRIMKSGHHVRYHAYKKILIPQPNIDETLKVAHSLKDCGWHVRDNNCVHQTFTILNTYAGEGVFPDPHKIIAKRFPKLWFSSIEGDYGVL